MKSRSVTIQMNATERYFPVSGAVYYLRSGSNFCLCGWHLNCDHSNESNWPILPSGAVYYAVQRPVGLNYWECLTIQMTISKAWDLERTDLLRLGDTSRDKDESYWAVLILFTFLYFSVRSPRSHANSDTGAICVYIASANWREDDKPLRGRVSGRKHPI